MKRKKVICIACGKGFKNEHGLRIHNHKMHPYKAPPPPPEPAREVTYAINELPETLRLKGAKLDVGDVFYHVRKFVVKKTVRTQGSDTLEVDAEITKKWWSPTQPI